MIIIIFIRELGFYLALDYISRLYTKIPRIMGELNVKKLTQNEEKVGYIDQLLTDIEALEYMLENKMFKKTPVRIGAEQ
ncbi:MAG: hypothetical protein WBN63_14530, partial [Eudoraea sp.]